MAGFLPDTSCMVAAVCAWHEHHEAAADEIERRLRARESLVVAGPALAEAYAVLTRLPASHRIDAADAREVLQVSFVRQGTLVALEAARYARLLDQAPDRGVTGGAFYDAVIAACAIKARVRAILTFNLAHFRRYADGGLEIVAPGS
jgi:predicted nucleic acid-binding protein